jgi:hypothetical protein
VCPDKVSEDLWTSRTLSTFQTFPRDMIHPSFAFMNGTDGPAYTAEDPRHLADGSGTTTISPDWVQVRFRENLQLFFDLNFINRIHFMELLCPA